MSNIHPAETKRPAVATRATRGLGQRDRYAERRDLGARSLDARMFFSNRASRRKTTEALRSLDVHLPVTIAFGRRPTAR